VEGERLQGMVEKMGGRVEQMGLRKRAAVGMA